MAVSENLASSPAEMQVSWADSHFRDGGEKGDRPSEKQKVGSLVESREIRTYREQARGAAKPFDA
jgi:hypothetical protein